PEIPQVLERLFGLCAEEEWRAWLSRIESSLRADLTVSEFVRAVGLDQGITGYSLHVVSVAIYAWLRHPGDFRAPLTSALECGGDTDTVGAILGALAGATVGQQGIPRDWLLAIWEWPRSLSFIERIAGRLADQQLSQKPLGPVRCFWPGLFPRNVLFLA